MIAIKNIEVEGLFYNTTLNKSNILLSEFSGEYEEVSANLRMNNAIHQYTSEEIFFALTTNTKRIFTTIHYLKFWAKHPGINCLIVFEKMDLMKNIYIRKYLKHEGIPCIVQTSNVRRYEERYLELFYLSWINQEKYHGYGERKKVKWFATGDDDTIWFINNLLNTLQQYNSSKSIYLGNTSDKKSQLAAFGAHFAYGGGGILLSRPLAILFAQHNQECKRFLNKFGGDEMIGKCVTEVLKVHFTKDNNFHQMDHRGDMTGLLESGIDGLVSLHHMFSWWKPFPAEHNDKLNETMHLLHIAYTTLDKHFLKRYVRVNQKTNQSLLLTMGYSFSLFNRILSHTELSLIEKTWCCGEVVGRETRPKEDNKITWYFQRVVTETSDRRAKYGIIYVHNVDMRDQFANIKVTLMH
jgi:hypothetical protein